LTFLRTQIKNYPKSLIKSTKNPTCIHPLPLGPWIPFISVSSTPVTGSWLFGLGFLMIGLVFLSGKSSDAGFWAQIVVVTLYRRRWGRCIDVLVKIQFCY